MRRRWSSGLVAAMAIQGAVIAADAPQPPSKTVTAPATKKIWLNETELSVVVTEGNSDTQTLGFKETLAWRWPASGFRIKLEALRTSTSDDWFQQYDPGITWEPGADPPPGTQSLVKPPSEPDAENYFAEGRYDRKITGKLNWHAGASWDRNLDAGILSRYIAFGGLGNRWYERDDFRFETSYGLSWTDREEEEPDPHKDERFYGARLGVTLFTKLSDNTTFNHDATVNVSLADTSDWTADVTNALSISVTKRISFRVSLRWLYANEPALEEVDLVARVEIRDPDGVPGSGDEYFETVSGGGSEITLGETRVRKEEFDQVFKTTLVLSF